MGFLKGLFGGGKGGRIDNPHFTGKAIVVSRDPDFPLPRMFPSSPFGFHISPLVMVHLHVTFSFADTLLTLGWNPRL